MFGRSTRPWATRNLFKFVRSTGGVILLGGKRRASTPTQTPCKAAARRSKIPRAEAHAPFAFLAALPTLALFIS